MANPFASADRRNLFAKASDEAYKQYYDLLERIDAPADDDMEKLADLLPFLNINMAQAARDFEVLKKAKELEAKIVASEKAAKEKQTLEPEYQKLSEEWAKVKTQWEPRLNQMSCRLMEIGRASCRERV